MFNLYFQGFVLAQWLQWATLVQGHVVLTYPGWRGNNLITNDEFPFGMQWMYPCGGLAPRGSTNRTHWPINGGAVAFQPGWFTGHENALIYVNIGLGEHPDNYSWPITRLYLEGPTDNPYPGTVCLSSLPLPEAVRSRVTSGDLATIQVVEAAKHGAGLFTCADIIFTDDSSKVPEVNEKNCFNSSDIHISDVAILGSQALPSACSSLGAAATAAVVGATASGDTWGWACEPNSRSDLNALGCPSPTSSASSAATGDKGNGAQSVGGKSSAMAVVAVVLALVLLLVGV